MSAKNTRRRDNFSASVIQILFKRAGGKCCRCAAPTFGPMGNNPDKSVNIGQGAHIAAAAPGGPRYDPKMTTEERASAANGMWMCSNCHDIIDRDVDEFPAAKLKTIKREAEQRAKKEMGVGMIKAQSTDSLSVGVSACTIVEIRKAKSELLSLNGHSIDADSGENLLAAVNFINPGVDSYLPEVGAELIVYYEQLVMHCSESSVRLEVLRRLKNLSDAFHEQWTRKDVEQMSQVCKQLLTGVVKRSRSMVCQSGTALLKDMATYRALRDKGFHNIPVKALRELRGADLIDGPPEKRICLNDTIEAGGPPPVVGVASSEECYFDLMSQLSQCEDQYKAEVIEEELLQLGYEPDVV